jgi:hypothetical protein
MPIGVGAIERLSLERGRLFIGQCRLSGELAGTLERRQRGKAPDALQIGLPLRRPRLADERRDRQTHRAHDDGPARERR